METLTVGLMAGCIAMCSRIPPPPSQIYNGSRLRNWLRHLFSSRGVLKNQPCLSSESWNDDIIVVILSRLPMKSLLRCRSVCKSWRALISRSDFVNKHLNQAVNRINDTTDCSIRLLFLRNNYFLDKCHPESMLVDSLKDFIGHTTSKQLDVPVVLEIIVGSCNGLICLAGCGGVFLWNPCTGEASKLPKQAFIAYWDHMFYGFGYDSSSEDYKVILGSKSTTKIDVFALKKGSWRNVTSLKDYGELSGQGCLSNGALHWVEKGYEYHNRYSSSSSIISYNLAEERFLVMGRLSFLLDKKYSRIGIGTVGNSLFVYCSNGVITDPIVFTIWMMKEYGVMESWSKVEIHRDCLPRSPALDYTGPIIILQNGEVLVTQKSQTYTNLSSFILYDPHKKRSRCASRMHVNNSNAITFTS
ncbi:hypothetical protein ACLB2K_031314 [Fragaria x ananassa]